jgi:hypothetical protein
MHILLRESIIQLPGQCVLSTDVIHQNLDEHMPGEGFGTSATMNEEASALLYRKRIERRRLSL